MKINSLRIFSLMIITLICLSVVQLRKKNKLSKRKLNRLAEEAVNKIENNLDWKKDPFLKELKNEEHLTTANSTKKFFLINMVIGKTIQLLGIKDEDVLEGLKQLDDKKKIDAFDIIMKFQKSMDMNQLKPISTKYTFKGLNETNFTPDKRIEILRFLDLHVRQPSI